MSAERYPELLRHVAIHEAAHGIIADLFGATDVRVHVWRNKVRNSHQRKYGPGYAGVCLIGQRPEGWNAVDEFFMSLAGIAANYMLFSKGDDKDAADSLVRLFHDWPYLYKRDVSKGDLAGIPVEWVTPKSAERMITLLRERWAYVEEVAAQLIAEQEEKEAA